MSDRKSPSNSIDPAELRRALGAFVTGVTVVTTREADGTPRGFTANSFTSVSLDPPLILVCIARAAHSFDVFCGCASFAVNILAEDQTETSAVFASKDPDKFARTAWRPGAGGSPILEATAAWLECARHEVVDAGDHVILIGRVTDFAHTVSNPLAFCRGAYVQFGLEREAVASAGQRTHIGAILEGGGRILMLRGQGGGFVLPTGPRLGAAGDPESLLGRLAGLGIAAEIAFLFAVYESDHNRDHWVFYRGEIVHGPEEGSDTHLFALDEIPWDRIADPALADMLARYVRERSENRFGIYVGDHERGQIHALEESA